MKFVPQAFARSTIAREGDNGTRWLTQLPKLVAELLERWDCVPHGDLMYGGVGVVVRVRRPDLGDAVLKVSFPHPGNDYEPDAFAAWRGCGAVVLHERDYAQYAMVLERAHSTTLATIADEDEIARVAGRLIKRLAIAGPPELPRLQDQADEWDERLLRDADELPHGMSRRVVDAARETIRDLGRAQPKLLVHGDLHGRNILRADREPWLAIDPKGCTGDPAYDAGTLLKTRALTLAATSSDPAKAVFRFLDIFTEAAELDRERVHRWSQLHAVQTAFWGRRHGFRRARSGPDLPHYINLADHLATLLTEPSPL
ncbi:aminoglycoside phosphotransferase family protein [Kribbella sp. NPDC023855]|uniref:aminoglycoside phosphotransferase family protein n=1 Tax=Kribbella sp. NPDC023855 TaxID=3154698 RepID=UPI0033F36700